MDSIAAYQMKPLNAMQEFSLAGHFEMESHLRAVRENHTILIAQIQTLQISGVLVIQNMVSITATAISQVASIVQHTTYLIATMILTACKNTTAHHKEARATVEVLGVLHHLMMGCHQISGASAPSIAAGIPAILLVNSTAPRNRNLYATEK